MLPLAVHLVCARAGPPAADNTSKNQRDRSGETRTSGDQSNSPEDGPNHRDYSSRRRQGSFTLCHRKEREDYYRRWSCHIARARLRKNEAEKTKIAELAQSAAGNAKIDNQLEVKASK